MTHLCLTKLTIIGSDNGFVPGRREAIIWTNAGIMLIGPLGINFSEILIEIHVFSSMKMPLKLSSVKFWPYRLSLNVVRSVVWGPHVHTSTCFPMPMLSIKEEGSVLRLMYIYIWVRSRNCGCLVTWFCYQLIAKPGNKTAAVPWPDPYIYVTNVGCVIKPSQVSTERDLIDNADLAW